MSDDSPSAFFSTSGHLTRHAANHSGTRKYRCDVPGCSSAFFRPDTLREPDLLTRNPLQSTQRIHAQRIANGLSPAYEVQQPHPPPYPSPPVLASSHPIVIYQNHPPIYLRDTS
ncbi:hypothetical protein BCR33DRAFT_719436, partial [Rhizoclosmatium globosum]